MKKFYTFFKQFSIAASVSLTLFSTSAFAQNPLCGPVVEDFDNTSGSTAGFTGNFVLGTSGGGSSANGFLIRSVVSSGQQFNITTPTYKLAASTTTLGAGFQLTGSTLVGTSSISLIYIPTNTGQITSYLLGNFVPGYTGGGNNLLATPCAAIDISSVPFFPAGGSYRFSITLTANSGNGGVNDNIIFDLFRTTGTIAQAPLPVNFMQFDAKKVSGGILVTWKVAGEENVKHYEVERSTDGRSFTKIGTVATDKTDTYNYLDANSNGTVYYRVKNLDNDGKFKYSSIARLVNGKSEIVLKAFPQPVSSQLTLQHPVSKGTSLVTITTADGRIIKTIKTTTGSMQTSIDMSNLQGGMYMLRFDNEGSSETMKVLKQ